ncbi:MAG: hypothetical protein AB7F86_06800 [Bdellovibrionales bacterium]
MKSVYHQYVNLFPKQSHDKLKPILDQVAVLRYPMDKKSFPSARPQETVVVVDGARLIDVLNLSGLGFEHIIQAKREDFANELLASSLMCVRPDSFRANPIPFFLGGFGSFDAKMNQDNHLMMRFGKPSEKTVTMDWIADFLDGNAKAKTLRDLVLQVADEMMTNALFNAPVSKGKTHLFKHLPRDAPVELSSRMAPTVFLSLVKSRLVIGCKDEYGTLTQKQLLTHLKISSTQGKAVLRPGGVGGAGLGFRLLIENSSNFYCLVEKGRFTIVACSFLLKGLRANRNTPKHFHASFG